MKKLTLYLALFLSTTVLFSQQPDTLYFHYHTEYKSWIPCNKDSADFFRPIPFEKEGELFRFVDYYINGQPQMIAYTSNKERQVYDGKVVWFYQDGTKMKEAEYKDGYKSDGKQITYFRDGSVKTSATYHDGRVVDGTIPFHDSFHQGISEFKEGVNISNYFLYSDSKQYARISSCIGRHNPNKTTYYDRDGKIIGETSHTKDGYPDTGTAYEFHKNENDEAEYITGVINYKGASRVGERIVYDQKRRIMAKGIYKDGNQHEGTFADFTYRNGIYNVNTFKNGVMNGERLSYDSDHQLICRGTIKNNEPIDGQFTNILPYDPLKLSTENVIYTLENGSLKGKVTYYYKDGDYKTIRYYHHLISDIKDGEAVHFDESGKEIARGIYKNDRPRSGTFYDAQEKIISSYKDGVLHGPYFEHFRSVITLKCNYTEGNREGPVMKSNGRQEKEHYKEYTCIYKNGRPFDGIDYNSSMLTYYKNGLITKEEYYDNEEKNIILINEYDQDKNKSKVIRIVDGKEEISIYKDGERYDGVWVNGNNSISYRKGVKHGAFKNEYVSNVLMSGNYTNGLLDGTIIYTDGDDNEIDSCVFKNGKPIDGKHIIEESKFTHYKDGLKHGIEEELFENNRDQLINKVVRNYSKDKLDGPIRYYQNDFLVREGIYKNGKPYEGYFYEESSQLIPNAAFEHRPNGTVYTFSPYVKGKKEGEENTFGLRTNTLFYTKVYQKGQLISSSIFDLPLKDKSSIKGTYKKGQAFDGEFFDLKNEIVSIERYVDGQPTMICYEYRKDTKPDTIQFQKGQAYQGILYELDGDLVYKHQYEKGKVSHSLIHNGTNSRADAQVTHLDNGYDIAEYYKLDKPHCRIRFNDKNRTSGKVSFEEEQDSMYILFDKGKVTEIKLPDYKNRTTSQWTITNNNMFTLKSPPIESIVKQFESDFKWPEEVTFRGFFEFMDLLEEDGTMHYFKEGSTEALCSLKINDRSRIEGYAIEIVGLDNYYIKRYIDEEEVMESEKMSLEKLVEGFRKE